MVGSILPLEALDKMHHSKICVLMKGDREFYGIFRGQDEYMNIVMDNVKVVSYSGDGAKKEVIAKVDSLLLNGTHIAMIIPGPDEENM